MQVRTQRGPLQSYNHFDASRPSDVSLNTGDHERTGSLRCLPRRRPRPRRQYRPPRRLNSGLGLRAYGRGAAIMLQVTVDPFRGCGHGHGVVVVHVLGHLRQSSSRPHAAPVRPITVTRPTSAPAGITRARAGLQIVDVGTRVGVNRFHLFT